MSMEPDEGSAVADAPLSERLRSWPARVGFGVLVVALTVASFASPPTPAPAWIGGGGAIGGPVPKTLGLRVWGNADRVTMFSPGLART